MAKYRQVHLSFWQDAFVIELTPEEKYFYLYLMTNSKTTQCGIYELPKQVIELETGYNRETVEKLLKRFEEYGKVIYSEKTSEIIVLNWVRYNWIDSVKVISLVNKELKQVKNPEFIRLFLDNLIENGYRTDRVSLPPGYPMDSLPIKREREEEEEREEEQEEEGNVFAFYQNNFGVLSPFVSENISGWISQLSSELVMESMKIALKSNKPFSYAEAILKNWYKKNIRTLEDVEADRLEFERSTERKNKGGSIKDEIGESSYE